MFLTRRFFYFLLTTNFINILCNINNILKEINNNTKIETFDGLKERHYSTPINKIKLIFIIKILKAK